MHMNRLTIGKKHNNPYGYHMLSSGYSSHNDSYASLNKNVFIIPGIIYKIINQIIILNN